jgi:lysophospholipase L1-like esterase
MRHPVRSTRLVAVAALALLGASLAPGAALAAPTAGTDPAPVARAAAQPVRYVALGDSFTAATGVPDPDPAGANCTRSTNNYPSVLARSWPGTEVVDVSCGAADTTHMTKPQKPFGAVVPPQFDALTADTDLVTIGIGGNDFGVFASLIFSCPQLAKGDRKGAPCAESMRKPGGGDRLLDKTDKTGKRVLKVVKGVQRRSPNARILLVGYPQIAPSRGTCATLPLAKGDYAYSLRINKRLNAVIRRAAKKTGAEYVNVWRASRGHDVCSEDPWVNGKDNTDQAIFYHPFANEQAAVAELIRAKVG